MGVVLEEAAWNLCNARGLVNSDVVCGDCPQGRSLSHHGFCRQQCAFCILSQIINQNPFHALDAPAEQWFAVAELFQSLPMPVPSRSFESFEWRVVPDAPGPDCYAFSGAVFVFWDGHDSKCHGFANALRHGFPSICRLVNVRDAEFESALARFPDLPRAKVFRECGVTGVLPTGTYIPECERFPQVLLYELQYRCSVQAPSPRMIRSYETEFLEPLARIRASRRGAQTSWWDTDEALGLVTQSMVQHRFAILDDFLHENVYQELALSLREFRRSRALTPGTLYYRLKQNLALDGPDLLSDEMQPLKWNMRTESLIYCGDDDVRAPSLARLGEASDRVISVLGQGGPDRNPECIERLAHTYFREPHLCACYSGRHRGRHARHVDNDSEWLHRTITAIIYFNDDWRKDHGGEFRLFSSEPDSTSVVHDVLPIANRMIFFWATGDCPHEVLQCNRDRFAISLIYVDGRASVQDSGRGLTRVLQELIPRAPLSREKALQLCACTAAEADRLIRQAQVLRGLGSDPHSPVAAPVPCFECGAVSVDGAMGDDHFSVWYCRACWRRWEEVPQWMPC